MLGVPLHVPVVAVSVDPSPAVPEIAGATVLTGPVAATVADAVVTALVEPAALVAVTRARTVLATSALVRA